MNTPNQSDKSLWSLDQWLKHLGQIHPANIDMGLERIQKVFRRLNLDFSKQTVVTVAGTNGKGTTCCLLEQAGLALGKSVAVYSSPHIIDYRERLRVNAQMLSEKQHCEAFYQVEIARAEISLTYFEFSTLAAMVLIQQVQPDWAILEVGLGGRLDAVNIVDPDIAVITSIDLDHQDWLGDTREKIAIEKAGILRKDIPVVIGEPFPPSTLVDEVARMTQQAYWQGKDFLATAFEHNWQWQNKQCKYRELPLPQIPLQNASTALQVLEILAPKMSTAERKQAIESAHLAGRFQLIQSKPDVILDVAHNPQATQLLALKLGGRTYKRALFVVGMLADKDIPATLAPVLEIEGDWYLASLEVPRGAKSEALASAMPINAVSRQFPSVDSAYRAAIKDATSEDLVVVFGSFYTVAHILQGGT